MTRAVVFALGVLALVVAGYALWRMVRAPRAYRDDGPRMFWLLIAALGIMFGGIAIGAATRHGGGWDAAMGAP